VNKHFIVTLSLRERARGEGVIYPPHPTLLPGGEGIYFFSSDIADINSLSLRERARVRGI
jgi:hypothetical protein